ncbi:24506_t:CDS:2 [Cetraspora pellucida]|uniref:24506_t:CDS:1 n=1 Tax=Cetraspora pellucida TaxID=1433469 RepID=A0A9N9E0J0_9GLOM|nr:24506_t:CDS:2 [Cetraspora pellucida]
MLLLQSLLQDAFIITPPSGNTFTPLLPYYTPTTSFCNALQSLLQNAFTTILLPNNAFTALPSYYTFITLLCNASQLLLQNAFTTMLLSALLFHYTLIMLSCNVSQPLLQNASITTPPSDNAFTALLLYYTFTILSYNILKDKTETKTLFEYGIIDFNDSIILEALEQLVILHFKTKIQEYKSKKALFTEVIRVLKTFNVVSN